MAFSIHLPVEDLLGSFSALGTAHVVVASVYTLSRRAQDPPSLPSSLHFIKSWKALNSMLKGLGLIL